MIAFMLAFAGVGGKCEQQVLIPIYKANRRRKSTKHVPTQSGLRAQ